MTATAIPVRESASFADILRQSLNIILVVTMILASNIEGVFGMGRSIAEQSATNDTPLVPWEFAFAIWGPIFLGLIAYSIIQGLPSNRAKPIFRATGWWTVLAFASVTLWGMAASLLDGNASRWSTAFLFWPAVAGACIATIRFSNDKHRLGATEKWLAWAPVSLFAGWVSLAMFLNWAQVGIHGGFGFGLSVTVISLLCLALALAFISWQLHLNRGNKVYAFPALWGLALLAYGRLAMDDLNPVIGGTAVAGFLTLLWAAIAAGRRQQPADI